MLHQSPESFSVTHPASLWTAEVKVRFLDCLSQRGNVRAACKCVGLSAETAYRQRRRDADFARAWAAANALALRVTEQVLTDRAIDGIEEEVWYRGELRGTRTRYDSRLLLAHLGRLDRTVDEVAEADADRFDELLAAIAGEKMPGKRDAGGESPLPDRESFVTRAMEDADRAVLERLNPKLDDHGEIADKDEARTCEIECETAINRAFDQADAQWDDWLFRAHGAVDAILGSPDAPARGGGRDGYDASLRTPSTASTPAGHHPAEG